MCHRASTMPPCQSPASSSARNPPARPARVPIMKPRLESPAPVLEPHPRRFPTCASNNSADLCHVDRFRIEAPRFFGRLVNARHYRLGAPGERSARSKQSDMRAIRAASRRHSGGESNRHDHSESCAGRRWPSLPGFAPSARTSQNRLSLVSYPLPRMLASSPAVMAMKAPNCNHRARYRSDLTAKTSALVAS